MPLKATVEYGARIEVSFRGAPSHVRECNVVDVQAEAFDVEHRPVGVPLIVHNGAKRRRTIAELMKPTTSALGGLRIIQTFTWVAHQNRDAKTGLSVSVTDPTWLSHIDGGGLDRRDPTSLEALPTLGGLPSEVLKLALHIDTHFLPG